MLASAINRIVDAVYALAYAAPEDPPSAMTEPVRAGTNDTLGALLTGVLDNLIRRLSKLETAKATATFAGSLGGQAREYHQSGIWRTMSSPPLKELAKLSECLVDVSCILHEMAHDSGAGCNSENCEDNAEGPLGNRGSRYRSALSPPSRSALQQPAE